MATEELIVLLDAKTSELDAKLRKTESRLDELDGSVNKTDSSLKKFSNGAQVTAGVVLKLAAAATAVTAAVTAMVLASASGRRELELLATQGKTTTKDFQALSFATTQYGIDAAKMGDASKDIADRIGEFAAAGTGVFQDYADVMKLSATEARAAAQEFEGLSSQEILGRMVSRMEDANVSGDKMLFVMESLANDASKLLPLFRNNSAELKTLKERFNSVNDSMQITGTQAAALRTVSETFSLLTTQSGNAASAISATLAPTLDSFFNDIIAVVPDATQTIIDFINSFLDAENISSVAGVNKEIEASTEEIDRLTGLINSKRQRGKELIKGQRDAERERLEALQAQLVVLEAQEKKIEDVKRLEGGDISGEGGSEVDSIDNGIGTGDEIAAIEDRFKLEETLLAEKLENELKLIGDNYGLRLDLLDEFEDNVKKLQKKRDKEADKERIIEEKKEKAKYEFKLDQAQGFMQAASIINSALFNDNKAIAAGLIVADTAAAVMKSLSVSPFDYANVAVIVATGIAQLSNALGASPGGGSTSSAAPSSAGTPAQSNFEPDTTSLDLSSSTAGGSSNQTITFAADAGDELMSVMVSMLQKAVNKGQA